MSEDKNEIGFFKNNISAIVISSSLHYSKVNLSELIDHKNYLIKAFQRRFRNQLIDGKIDKECYEISKKLSIL